MIFQWFLRFEISTIKQSTMSFKMNILFHLPIFIISLNPCILALGMLDNVVINKCQDFDWDSELLKNYSITNITIPGYLMAEEKAMEFRLSERALNMECNDNMIIRLQQRSVAPLSTLTTNENETTIKPPLPRGYKMRGKIYNHFTKDGFLMIDSTYYDRNNYCVLNFSSSSVVVKVCDNSCSSGSTKGQNCINIPKCCGLGQELVYWRFECRDSKKNIWTPQIYSDPHRKLSKEENVTLKYSRPLLKCKSWEPWPLSKVQRPKKNNKPPDEKLVWRLLKDGSVLWYHIQQRTWVPLPKGDFCIDGFVNWGHGEADHYSGSEKEQVILLCPDEMPPKEQSSLVAYLYASFLFFSSQFLLLTAIVHIALREKLPVHGLTVLSHSVSMFLMYIFLGMAYLTAAKSIDNSDDGVKRGSFICILIGVLAHLFFLTTFFWLTIMNFDLWWTFRIVKPMGQVSKRMKRFRIYSAVGWGVPLAIISTFVGLDFSYSKDSRDIENDIIVPDYGVNSCFVACYARGHYIYSILAILIFINLIFIVSTCITFIRFQRNNQSLSSKKTTNFKLFSKLFFIMGVAWCFELYSWVQNPCTNTSWQFIFLDFFMFLQAAGNFVIFCCNGRIVAQLEEKFPQYKQALKPIKTIFCIKSQNSSGEGYGMGNPASGSTMRKLSTTISTSAQTDQAT